MGEPLKPGPIPVASTFGPDTRTNSRVADSPLMLPPTTSRISTSNGSTAVPRNTDQPVQRIPGCTWLRGMIGSPAPCAGAAEANPATRATATIPLRIARKLPVRTAVAPAPGAPRHVV